MATIVKEFKITNWTEYEECPVGDVTGMREEPAYPSIINTHPVVITGWMDDAGNGFERVVYTTRF